MFAWRNISCAAVNPKRLLICAPYSFSERVQRRARDDSVRAQPREQRADLVPTAVVVVDRGASAWGAIALDHEVALASRVKAAKDLDEFRIDEHVALAAVRLRPEVLRRLDADQSLVPSKRRPRKLVDLVSSQARHRGEKEDLELLGFLLCKLAAGALDQRREVERRPISRDAHRLDLDPSERRGLGNLDDVANTRERLFVEESAGLQNATVRRHASALLFEWVRRPANVLHAPRFDLLIRERLELDVPGVARPSLAPRWNAKVKAQRLKEGRETKT